MIFYLAYLLRCFLTYALAVYLILYLTYIMLCIPAFYLVSVFYSPCGILSEIYSGILFGILSDILFDICSGILSDILYDICWHSIWQKFWLSMAFCLNSIGIPTSQGPWELTLGPRIYGLTSTFPGLCDIPVVHCKPLGPFCNSDDMAFRRPA